MKRVLLICCILFFALDASAVTTYWAGTTSTAWSNVLNWASTSGGVGGTGIVPLNTTDVVLDGAGINNTDCTADIGTLVCLSFTVTSGYTHKLTCTVNIDVNTGGMSLGANMTFTASTTKGFRNSGVSSTWTSNGVTVPVLITMQGATTTLGDNWTITGGLTTSGTTILNSNTLNIAGGTLTITNALSGTTAIVFGTTGNMTWTGTNTISNNVTINTSGTLTVSGSVAYGINTLTYTAGTLTTTGSTLTLSASCTLNTNGATWNNVTVGNNTTTLNSLLTIGGNLSMTSSVWAGTAGWTCANLKSNLNGAPSATLHSGNTYTVTTNINWGGSLNSNGALKASTASSSAFLNYSGTAPNEWLSNCNFTDIDASGGGILYVINGTLTRTANITARTAQSGPYTIANPSIY